MAQEWLLVTWFAAAALMMALAGWLLYLDWRGVPNRLFALYLLFRSVVLLGNFAQVVFPDPSVQSYFDRVGRYYFLGFTPILLAFIANYPRRWRVLERVPGGAATLLLSFLVPVELLYMSDHCLDYCVTATGAVSGPLAVVANGSALVGGVASWYLLRQAMKDGDRSRRAALGLVGTGLLLNAYLDGGISLTTTLVTRTLIPFGSIPSVWAVTARLLPVLALVPAALALVDLRRLRIAEGSQGEVWRRAAILGAAAFASGIFIGFQVRGTAGAPNLVFFLIGIWRLALPLFGAYAIIRHRLFGIDVKARAAVNRGFLGAVFVVAFIVIDQIVQNLFTAEFDWVVAGIATTGLLFVTHPLQRAAEGVAKIAIPESDPPVPERTRLYWEQARVAWSDGPLDDSERKLLDDLSIRLGISRAEAVRLEESAARLEELK